MKLELRTPAQPQARKPIRHTLYVGKDYLRRIDIPSPDARKSGISIFHLYPTLANWQGRVLPDQVNPRSHDKECLRSEIAKAIEQTIHDTPEDFCLANRGSTVLVDELNFDPKSGNVELVINDAENQGLADGATTDAVIGKVQAMLAGNKSFKELTPDEMNANLQNARIHVEVIVGLGKGKDRARIAHLVGGRNSSRQVRGWSMADFSGHFDWIKEILEAADSPVKGMVGYEENAGKHTTILDILSLLTLMHKSYEDDENGEKAPTEAYASKGRMGERMIDPMFSEGYKALAPIVLDILRLSEFIQSEFEPKYEKAFKNGKLGLRQGVEVREISLPFTGMKANYFVPNGFIYPLLSSFRALIKYVKSGERKGLADWRTNPFEFFTKYGAKLIRSLMDAADETCGGNPNSAGKKRAVYTAVFQQAKILLNEELNKED